MPVLVSSSNASRSHSFRIPEKMFATSFVCGTHFVLPISTPLRQNLRLSSTFSAPPRRKPIHASSSLPPPASSTPFAASETSSSHVNLLERSSESDAHTPLSAALSQMTGSSALLAGTAFVIATSIVGLSTYGVVWRTKTSLGVDDPRHFGLIIRSILSTTSLNLTSSIHPAAETDDEMRAA
ncbi:hypothetical protein CPC08DRAFT_770140 [Agrocybe pediades]|nr:hypothetical protein CPC08DRAFT_770140 [Agrocybe pediades]